MTMAKAMRFLKRGLDATVGVHVTIIAPGEAGGEAIEQVEATPATSNFVEYTTDEYAVSAKEFDWLVKAADLVFPITGKLEPQDGWEVHYELEDGRTAVYVVRPQNNRCFDVEDPLGILLMLHTKLNRIEPA